MGFLGLLAGCATHADRLREVRENFYAGNLTLAEVAIEKHLERPKGEADVLRLDRAILELAAGQPRKAEQTLREVRDTLDHLEQKPGRCALTSSPTTRRPPIPAKIRKVLRAFLALSNLCTRQRCRAYP